MRIATFACLGVLASCGRVDHARLALEKLTTGRLVEAEIEAELHATTATAGASAFRDAIQACTSHARALASARSRRSVGEEGRDGATHAHGPAVGTRHRQRA